LNCPRVRGKSERDNELPPGGATVRIAHGGVIVLIARTFDDGNPDQVAGFDIQRSAMLGLSIAALSQASFVIGSGNSWSHPLL